MKSDNESLDDENRLAQTDGGKRLEVSQEAYAALNRLLNGAMAQVYANRSQEIDNVVTRKTYSNSIVGYAIRDAELFSFGEAFMPYLQVRDRFSISGYGQNLSINVATSFASVTCDRRTRPGEAWSGNSSFGQDGRFQASLGDLSTASAIRAANLLVDAVKQHIEVMDARAATNQHDTKTPFMTSIAGHVLIHDFDTGRPLTDTWTGICVDGRDVQKFWYIGRSGEERSYSALTAKTFSEAQREASAIIRHEFDEIRLVS